MGSQTFFLSLLIFSLSHSFHFYLSSSVPLFISSLFSSSLFISVILSSFLLHLLLSSLLFHFSPSLSLSLSLWPLCCVCACGESVVWCLWRGVCGGGRGVCLVCGVCGVARNKLSNGSIGLSSPLPKHVERFPHRSRWETPLGSVLTFALLR